MYKICWAWLGSSYTRKGMPGISGCKRFGQASLEHQSKIGTNHTCNYSDYSDDEPAPNGFADRYQPR